VVINATPQLDREAKASLIHRASNLLVPMLLMPFLGVWYLSSIPADSRSWALGGSAAMTLFLTIAVGASLLIGLYALIGLVRQRLYINGATATLLVALAFGATAGGEFVREGVRKPYTIRQTLYSNSIRPAEVARLRQVGCVSGDPYPLRDAADYPNDQLKLGARVFRFQCSVCHTLNGMNGLSELAGTWTIDQKRMNIAKLQHTKPFMPPFAGTSKDLEALVQLLTWKREGEPKQWPLSQNKAVLGRIDQWLAEAGTVAAAPKEVAKAIRGGS